MKIYFITIFFLCSMWLFSQEIFQPKIYENPIDEINDEILMAENSLKNTDFQPWIRIEKIICLSGIKIKKVDHQYSGLSFKPNNEELEELKYWFQENKSSLKYSIISDSNSKIIIHENVDGVLKKSNCLYE